MGRPDTSYVNPPAWLKTWWEYILTIPLKNIIPCQYLLWRVESIGLTLRWLLTSYTVFHQDSRCCNRKRNMYIRDDCLCFFIINVEKTWADPGNWVSSSPCHSCHLEYRSSSNVLVLHGNVAILLLKGRYFKGDRGHCYVYRNIISAWAQRALYYFENYLSIVLLVI